MSVKQRVEQILIYICYIINIFVPKNKKQVFFYSMPDYSDNARAIYEELVRQKLNQKYKIVWAVRDVEKYKNLLNGVTVVRHRSIKNLFCFCRSYYIFRTHSLWGNLYVQNRQKMFVAWHGMPLKSLLEGNPKPYKCDYLNTTSPFFEKHIYSAVAIPKGDNPSVGLARNDLLLKDNTIIHDLGYDKYNKVYLWMPTFRNSLYSDIKDGIESEIGIPILSLNDLEDLNQILAKHNDYLVLKLHPWSAQKIHDIKFSNICNLRDQDIIPPHSLYDLVGKVDVLITDYSSVYIDFLLVNRPIWFVYDDIEDYRNTRGFAFEPAEDYMPGIKIKTRNQLFSCFDGNYDDNNFIKDRENVRDLFHVYSDSGSAARALALVGIK